MITSTGVFLSTCNFFNSGSALPAGTSSSSSSTGDLERDLDFLWSLPLDSSSDWEEDTDLDFFLSCCNSPGGARFLGGEALDLLLDDERDLEPLLPGEDLWLDSDPDRRGVLSLELCLFCVILGFFWSSAGDSEPEDDADLDRRIFLAGGLCDRWDAGCAVLGGCLALGDLLSGELDPERTSTTEGDLDRATLCDKGFVGLAATSLDFSSDFGLKSETI